MADFLKVLSRGCGLEESIHLILSLLFFLLLCRNVLALGSFFLEGIAKDPK